MDKEQVRGELDVIALVCAAGEAAVRAVDELGWSFLAAHGYDVAGWDSEDESVARGVLERIAAELEARGEEIAGPHGAVDDESPRLAVWYSLWRGEEQVANSCVIQLRFGEREAGGAT